MQNVSYVNVKIHYGVNPVVDFGITLCAGGFATMPKFTTGSNAAVGEEVKPADMNRF